MIWLIIIVIYFILQSAFCVAAKNHQNISKAHEENSCREIKKKVTPVKALITFIYTWCLDFTFISFKVVGYIPSHFVRKLLYKYVYHMILGKNCVIYYGLEARSPWNITIGDGTIIGDHAIMDARYGICIGKNVNISSGVWIWTLQHDLNSPDFGVAGQGNAVEIADRAWISSRTTILPGMKVLEGDVLASGAILTKSFEKPFQIYGGVPAKHIGDRNKELTYVFDGKHRMFL